MSVWMKQTGSETELATKETMARAKASLSGIVFIIHVGQPSAPQFKTCQLPTDSSDQIKVWDLEMGDLLDQLNCDSAALCCSFAADDIVLAGDEFSCVHFLSLEVEKGN